MFAQHAEMWHECKSLHDVCVCAQSQHCRQPGVLRWSDWDGVSRVFQERETSTQRELGPTWSVLSSMLLIIFVSYLNSLSVHWKSSPCSFCCTLSVFVSGPRMNGQSRMDRHMAGYESATTVMSSELDTTSFCDSEDDDTMSRSEQMSFLLF